MNNNYQYAKQLNIPGIAERREKYSGGQLTRTLDQIIKNDYYGTQKVLREIFVPDYSSGEFDSIVPALNWIKASDSNLNQFLNTGFAKNKLSNLPDCVRQNQATISLWFELAQGSGSEKEDIPVAFSVNTQSFREDLSYLVFPRWKKLSTYPYENGKVDLDVISTSRTLRLITKLYTGNVNGYRIEAEDVLGEQLFRIYWHRLVERYKFISGCPT